MATILDFKQQGKDYQREAMSPQKVLEYLVEIERKAKALEQEVIRLRSEMQDYD